jgi:murein DD-endopeptidase MepM/ murein hydrolase activator NlpD
MPVATQVVPNQVATHVVKSGDTVYSIARRYKVDMAALVRLNAISASYAISPGQRLLLPGHAGATTALAGLPAANSTKLSSAAATAAPTQQPVAWTASSQPAVAMVPPPEVTGPIPKAPPRAGDKFLWPVDGKLLLKYGPKPGGLHNDGINIAAPRGSPVRAADNGVVAYTGNELRGFGNLLLIKHDGGWMTAYAHNEAILVGRGAKVKRGQTVARVGDSGSVVTPQLHFEIRRGIRAVDPAKQLGPRQSAQTM